MKVYMAGSGLDIFYSPTMTERSVPSKSYLTDLTLSMQSYPATVFHNDDGSVASLSDMCVQFRFKASTTPNNSNSMGFVFMDASNNYVWRLSTSPKYRETLCVQRYASGWQTVMDGIACSNSNDHVVDIMVTGVGTATASFSVYMDNVLLVDSAAADMSANAPVAKVYVMQLDGIQSTILHSIIVADSLTVGCYVQKMLPAEAGTYADWTGTLTDAATVPVDSTKGVISDTAGQKVTTKTAALSIDTTKYAVAAVVVSGITTIAGSGPGTRLMLKQGATESLKAGTTAVGTSAGFAVWNTDPTGAEWTLALVNSAEYGVESGTS